MIFRLRGDDPANRRLVETLHHIGRIVLGWTAAARLAAVCHRTHRAGIGSMIEVLHQRAGSE